MASRFVNSILIVSKLHLISFFCKLTDMEVLKKRRSALAGEIIRIWNKYQKCLTEDPDILDLGQLGHQLDSIRNSDASYRKVHLDIANSNNAELNPDEEQSILDQHEDAVEQTLSLIT